MVQKRHKRATRRMLLPLPVKVATADPLAVLAGVIAVTGTKARDLTRLTGLSETRISNIRRRSGRPPERHEKDLLARALGIPVDLLFPATDGREVLEDLGRPKPRRENR